MRRLADRCGGRAVGLYAPASVEAAPGFAPGLVPASPRRGRTLAIAARASVALVASEDTDDGCTMVRDGSVSLEIRRLRDAAVATCSGTTSTRTALVEVADTARLVGLSLDGCHAIDWVVVVVSKDEEPLAILGVLRTGVVDVLVIDEGNAPLPGGAGARGDAASVERSVGTCLLVPTQEILKRGRSSGGCGVAAINVMTTSRWRPPSPPPERAPLIVQTSVEHLGARRHRA